MSGEVTLEQVLLDAAERVRKDPGRCPYCGRRGGHWNCPLLPWWWEVRGLSRAPGQILVSAS